MKRRRGRQKRLRGKFYNRPTSQVAKGLLGKFLVRQIGKKKLVGKIVETEAYVGFKDKASHASRGKTERNKVMFGGTGKAYVYFTYGMHWLLNVVTERKGFPAAVLIRALEPKREQFGNLDIKKLRGLGSGPARLTKWMGIDGDFNGEDLVRSKRLWIEDRGEKIKTSQIMAARRVGVEYAGAWKDKKWRFYLKGNALVSKK